jgi:hypothetical protein
MMLMYDVKKKIDRYPSSQNLYGSFSWTRVLEIVLVGIGEFYKRTGVMVEIMDGAPY